VRHDDQENIVVFGSDVIDLSDIDLTTLSELPSAALRAAIVRVCEELSGSGDQSAVYAGFRSSLRAGRITDQGSASSEQSSESSAGDDTADTGTDALR
jgi:FXSXX-COOH protein